MSMQTKELEQQEKPEEPELIVECPHCKEPVIIEKLNCHIFRHGIIKQTGQQMDPHAPKNVCDDFFQKGLIFGCGKPFKIIKKEDGKHVSEICEYI
jgi:hypothetical protein